MKGMKHECVAMHAGGGSPWRVPSRMLYSTYVQTMNDDMIFNPDDVGVDNGSYFGFPFTDEQARLVLVSVPWDVTVSYGSGASYAPDAIIEASTQLDFCDPIAPDAWRKGIATAPVDYTIQELSQRLRHDAERVIQHLEHGGEMTGVAGEMMTRRLKRVNEGCRRMNDLVYEQTSALLDCGKIVGLVGGDHSVPYGFIKAVGERRPGMGILHIDAHCDLRSAYEGFEFSHASVMYNVLRDVPQVGRIVQVGVRDFCRSEYELAKSSPRVDMFDDLTLARNRFDGMTWAEQCRQIVGRLPEEVYVSFDIDGLSMELCPHTGTPVPGGLSFNEAVHLVAEVVRSGRRIVGFDMVEVVPSSDDRTDAIVGARILWKLCQLTLAD